MAADGLLVVHGGGPTAVINASLYGAVDEALRTPGVGRVLGARGGMGGILDADFVDFRQVSPERLSLLPHSPSSRHARQMRPHVSMVPLPPVGSSHRMPESRRAWARSR